MFLFWYICIMSVAVAQGIRLSMQQDLNPDILKFVYSIFLIFHILKFFFSHPEFCLQYFLVFFFYVSVLIYHSFESQPNNPLNICFTQKSRDEYKYRTPVFYSTPVSHRPPVSTLFFLLKIKSLMIQIFYNWISLLNKQINNVIKMRNLSFFPNRMYVDNYFG